jgi:hypothetical protein
MSLDATRLKALTILVMYECPSGGPQSWCLTNRRQAELIFDTMAMIRDNWTHYRNIYKNNTPTYRKRSRTEYCLVNGQWTYIKSRSIPWQLASLTP